MILKSLAPPDYDLIFCSLSPPPQIPFPRSLSPIPFRPPPPYTPAFPSQCLIFSEIFFGALVKKRRRETPNLSKDGKFQAQRTDLGEAWEEGTSPGRDLLYCPRAIRLGLLWGQIVFPCLKFQFN